MGVISRAAVHQCQPGRLPTPEAGAAGVLGDPGSHQFWGRDGAQGEEWVQEATGKKGDTAPVDASGSPQVHPRRYHRLAGLPEHDGHESLIRGGDGLGGQVLQSPHPGGNQDLDNETDENKWKLLSCLSKAASNSLGRTGFTREKVIGKT